MSKYYEFALCIDPDTAKYYSINLNDYSIHLEQFNDLTIQEEFQNRAKNAIADLRKIISWEQFNYGITKETNFYRRRRIPEYLLQDPKVKIPCYLAEQPLQRAITQDPTFDQKGEKKTLQTLQIDAQIYLVQYADVIRSKQPFRSQPERTIPKVFTCKLRLPNPINDVIKVIIKMAFQKQQIELTTRRQDCQFVLKVFGSESYFYGNTTFVKYQYVRKCLRNRQVAKFQLTQKKLKYGKSRLRSTVIQRLKKDVDLGIYKQIKWANIRQDQPFLWYPPSPLNAAFIAKQKQKKDVFKRYHQMKVQITEAQKQVFYHTTLQYNKLRQQLDQYSQQQSMQMPRLILKESMLNKISDRKQYAFNKIIQINNNMIFSGQCEFSFSLKIIGITRFNNLLKQSNYAIFEEDCRNFNNIKKFYLSVVVKFVYGDQILQWKKISPVVIYDKINLNSLIEWSKLSCLPLQTKLLIELFVFSEDKKQGINIGIATINMYDEKGYLNMGQQKTNIWPFAKVDLRKIGCIGSYNKGFTSKQSDFSQLIVQFPRFHKKVRWSFRNSQVLYNFGYGKIDVSLNTGQPKIEQLTQLQSLLKMNTLQMVGFNQHQKKILKICYQKYCKNSQKYMNFLYSINWSDPTEAYKAINARQMLNKQKQQIVKSSHYIGVFVSRFVDQCIRSNAVDKLLSAPDDQILLYIPQLVQALLSQTIHHSCLGQMLLERAVLSPWTIGQALFWQLRSQLHKQFQFQRYAVLLQCLTMTSIIRPSFLQQMKNHQFVQDICQNTKNSFNSSTVQGMTQYFRTKQLPRLRKHLSIPFILPINHQKQNNDFNDKQCSVVSLKKANLIFSLTQNPERLKNNTTVSAKTKPYIIGLQTVIYKSNEDLRLNQVILQMIRIMDNIWLQKSLDFKLIHYKVMIVSDMMGYVQVLGDFQTTFPQILTYQDQIDNKQKYDTFLKKNNPKKEDYLKSVDNFIKSTAGYFIACYVLGLQNFKNGNDMLTKLGMFFHIGYSHIFKSFNNNQSGSPFQFTQLFKYVLQKHKYENIFAKLCCDAYHQIRKNTNLILQMLMMMVSAQIPQLYDESNLKFIINRLSLQMNKFQASQKMRNHIKQTFQIQLSKTEENIIAPIVSQNQIIQK